MSNTVRATPVLDLAGKISIAFVFTSTFPEMENASASLDLDRLRNALDRNPSLHSLRDAYVRPLDAFITDICDPKTAGMHFPLLMQLPVAPGAVKDVVQIRFPETFEYSAEKRDVCVEEIKRTASCRFRESFALFDTGRFYYSICFIQDEDVDDGLDEYGVIQLLQIAEPTYLSRDIRNDVRFDFGDGHETNLLDAATRRLSAAMGHPENCVHDVVKRFTNVSIRAFSDWDQSLSHCLVQIEDAYLLKLSQTASEVIVDGDGHPLESYSPSMARSTEKAAAHGNEDLPMDVRRRVSLAGICQNVCDFPYQDSSEVEDSLRPVYSDNFMSFHFRRRIFVEICASSRSLAAAKSLTGICPYFFFVCLLIRFDEHLLDLATETIRHMAYGPETRTEEHAIRVDSFQRLFDGLEAITNPLSGSSERDFRKMIKNNLQLLRDFHFRFLASPFRYQTEREMFASAIENRSIMRRYDDINALIDRHSQRIDEIQRIGDSRAAKLLNVIILWLTIIQAIVVLKDVLSTDDVRLDAVHVALYLTLAGFIVFVGCRIAWPAWRARWSRRSDRH